MNLKVSYGYFVLRSDDKNKITLRLQFFTYPALMVFVALWTRIVS